MSGGRLLVAALVGCAGCAGGKRAGPPAAREPGGEDAAAPVDAPPATPPGAAAPYRLAPRGGPTGAVEVRVEWLAPPAEWVTSRGLDACGEPRRPALAVDALGGVADVVVRLEPVERGRPPPPPAPVALAVEPCRIAPPVALAGRLGVDLELASASERRQVVQVDRIDAADERVAEVDLAVVGRRVRLAIDRPGIYRLAVVDEPAEPSYLVAPGHPYFALTDSAGQAALTEVPPGDYQLVAWHRPLPDGTPLEARAPVAVVAGAAAAVTLSLAR